MSFFSSPQQVGVVAKPQENPDDVAHRKAIETETAGDREKVGSEARRRLDRRTMGTEGANALFTGGAAGYGRTMGSANV